MKAVHTNDAIKSRFFLYTGKINAVALNTRGGNGRILDQHGVRYYNPDIDDWENSGVLKVYCPSFLVVFEEGQDYQALNNLFAEIAPQLATDIPLHETLHQGVPLVESWFHTKIDSWMRSCLATPGKLWSAVKRANDVAYDRSVWLQDRFYSLHQPKMSDRDRLVLAIARLKAIYISMAPHYSVEAHMDDTFIETPWHLPLLVSRRLVELGGGFRYIPELDEKTYRMGLKYHLDWAMNPDIYRFMPILASLLYSFVTERREVIQYQDWRSFQEQVVDRVGGEVREVFEDFAKSMSIDLSLAFFAAWKMLQKDLRKRGASFLYTGDEALAKYKQIKRSHLEAFSYYWKKRDVVQAVFGKRRRIQLERVESVASVIEFFNSYIGIYKFLPWKIDDANFQGKYMPYHVMRYEKAALHRSLMADSHVWQDKGVWFRDTLRKLLASDPTMYAKWFIPLLEDGFIDPGIISEANKVCLQILSEMP